MENNFEHVMLDLETMGNKSNAAIVSIGAVEFDINTGDTGDEFYERIDLKSSLMHGLNVDASTIYWWLGQNEEARQELLKKGGDLSFVLGLLNTWFDNRKKDFFLWGNGARFDIGLLEDAYVACYLDDLLWSFRNERDVRTLVSLRPEIKKQVQDEWMGKTVLHHPINDCKIQIDCVSRIWRNINNIK